MGKRILTWLGFGTLVFVVFMSINAMLWAQENQCFAPTDPGEELSYPENWSSVAGILKVFASSETISPAAPVSVWVESDGWGKPPYEWEVSGTGYSLDKGTTESDFETVTLTSVSGTCGTNYDALATVTVTDADGAVASKNIRSTAGQWGLDGWAYVRCGYDNYPYPPTDCGQYPCSYYTCTGDDHITYVDNKYRWVMTTTYQCNGCPSGCGWVVNGDWATGDWIPPVCVPVSSCRADIEPCAEQGCKCTPDTFGRYSWRCQ